MATPTTHFQGWALALLVPWWGVNPGWAEIVYENIGTTNNQPSYFPATVEYGDEVQLAGIGREIVQFRTEYFSELPVTNQATGRIRFYANDGPGQYPSPGTVLFESNPFPIGAGYNAITLGNLAISVPDDFTWTIEFAGLSGAVGQQAGLLLYNPPMAGFSYNDFWLRTGTNWALFQLSSGAKANFAARIIAKDILNVRLDGPQMLPGGDVKLQLTGLVGRTCVVQASSNLTNWNAIGLFDFTKNREMFVETSAPSMDRRFYRALTTVGGPLKLNRPTLSTNRLIELQAVGPERFLFVIQASSDFVTWTNIATNTFGSRPILFADPESANAGRRFYRTRLVP